MLGNLISFSFNAIDKLSHLLFVEEMSGNDGHFLLAIASCSELFFL